MDIYTTAYSYACVFTSVETPSNKNYLLKTLYASLYFNRNLCYMQELVDRYTNPYNVKDPAHNAKLTPWEHIKVRRQYSAHAKQKT